MGSQFWYLHNEYACSIEHHVHYSYAVRPLLCKTYELSIYGVGSMDSKIRNKEWGFLDIIIWVTEIIVLLSVFFLTNLQLEQVYICVLQTLSKQISF